MSCDVNTSLTVEDLERFYRYGRSLNIQHRTLNVEHRMMNSLRSAILLRQLAYLIENSMLDVGCSTFMPFFGFNTHERLTHSLYTP